MNDILMRKIKSVFEINSGNYSRLEISIECPLDSGVRVTGVMSKSDASVQPEFGGVKDFFLYVNEYRRKNPDILFNRVSIIADKFCILDVIFNFDELLQKQTMENIK